jgi:membrane protein implicated in regulation of membrane protease activity
MLWLEAWEFWAVLGVSLIILEMITVSYFALGFAVASGLMILISPALSGLGAWIAPLWASLGLGFWYGLARLWRYRAKNKVDINDFDSRASLPESDLIQGRKWAQKSESYPTDTEIHDNRKKLD